MASAFLTIEKASKIKDPFAFAPYVLSGIYRTRKESDGLRIEILIGLEKKGAVAFNGTSVQQARSKVMEGPAKGIIKPVLLQKSS